MKVAHLIMAHKAPAQLERLLRRLTYPNFHLFVHIDRKTDIADFLHLKELCSVSFIENRNVCNWGGFSFVRAITESVREILTKSTEFEYINLMSAQDYPIKSNRYLYEILKNNYGKNYISYEILGASDWWKHARTRYEKYHFTDVNIKGKYYIQRLTNRFLPKRQFPLSTTLYGSANASWWTLTSDCLRHILDMIDHNAKLASFMRFTWGGDEFLYPTLIMGSKMKTTTINNNYRYIKWTNGAANPNTLVTSDLKSMLESDCWYARKFDLYVDSGVLDEIDTVLDSKAIKTLSENN